MFSIINTGKTQEECIRLIDEYINKDTDLELPNWGEHKQYYKGIHFVRKGNKLSGICRFNDWNDKEALYKMKRLPIYLRFRSKLLINKKGKVKILTVTFPQFSFCFLVLAFLALTFAFWYKQDIEKTGFFATAFGMGLCFTIFEQIRLEMKFMKEYKSFFINSKK